MTTEKCGWVLRCEQGPEAHAHTQPWDMHPGIANHAFVPTDPTALRTALSALVEVYEAHDLCTPSDDRCTVLHDLEEPIRIARAALATLPATEERGDERVTKALVDAFLPYLRRVVVDDWFEEDAIRARLDAIVAAARAEGQRG